MSTPLPAQLARKQARIAALLSAGANPIPAGVWESPAASAPQRFRNKAKMVVAGTAPDPILGILGPGGHGVDLRTCPLHVPEIEAALPVLARTITALGLTPYDVSARRGELKHVLVTASPDGDLMVRFVLRSRRHMADLRAALPVLQRELPTLAVLSANIQPVHQAIIEGPEEVVLTADDRLLMRLRLPTPGTRELPLYLPTRSFFQTNTAIAEQLYATARDWADAALSGPARVWDLFCGVGGFALALAGPSRSVLGVEVSASAIDGARASARLMRLPEERVRFEAGDAAVLDPGAGAMPDLLVVNPPRRGIGAELAARIEASGVERVLYSSCNPESLAKDLEQMPSLRVQRARLFDMFPHTDHAEVLVSLRRDR
ncbi:methyltransferase domain-containing protein [Actinomyces ruminis]|nr:methyltransferase domain-containing protein [Actinomyces ruminis]